MPFGADCTGALRARPSKIPPTAALGYSQGSAVANSRQVACASHDEEFASSPYANQATWERSMNNRTRIATVLVVAAVAVGAAFAYAWQPALTALPGPPPASDDQALLARGARIASVGDCMVCHTAAHRRALSGGPPPGPPVGTLFT